MRHSAKRTVILMLLAFFLVSGGLFAYLGASENMPGAMDEQPKVTERSAYPEEIDGIPVTTAILPKEYAGRPGKKRLVEFVVIHETANESIGSDAKAHSDYLMRVAKDSDQLSWHYTVDDHEIYHHLPDNEAAYHAGDGLRKHGGNLNGIGVEICINEDGDYARAVDNAAALTAYLLKEYGLEKDDIRQHHDCDPNGKDCPRKMRAEEDGWIRFKEKVAEKYEACQDQPSA